VPEKRLKRLEPEKIIRQPLPRRGLFSAARFGSQFFKFILRLFGRAVQLEDFGVVANF